MRVKERRWQKSTSFFLTDAITYWEGKHSSRINHHVITKFCVVGFYHLVWMAEVLRIRQ